jgi:putative transposase
MKRTRFTETQIVKAIQEHENGRDAKELCRELGVSTFFSATSPARDVA